MMKNVMTGLLDEIKIGARQTYENMTLFCLLSANCLDDDLVSLDQALENHGLKISEIDEHGSVPELRIVNPSPKKILIVDGEEVVGAKQNRVVNTTILLAPESKTTVPVSCVEEGRWAYRNKHFTSASHSMSAELRRRKTDSVTRNLRRGSQFEADQAEVWRGIERKYASLAVNQSPTMAMSDLYEWTRPTSNQYLKAFSPVACQIGIAVLINGEIAGIEVINHFDVFRNNHKKLVHSYVMDAIETSSHNSGSQLYSPRSKTVKFIDSIKAAGVEKRSSVALGKDIRLESKKIIGAGLEFGESILQLSAFPNSENTSSRRPTNLRRASDRRRRSE